ncbi:MAG: hypothetical protein LRY66_02490 [Saccharospirillaceae bacterium]|nr:hypothetical protein [Saccharospirillaceae bacterium]MCD8530231.1 hypothetical protein [Saccharospirillaceae bacterium]
MNYAKLVFVSALLLAGCDQPAQPQSSPPDQTSATDIRQDSVPDSSAFAAHLGLSAYTEMSMAAQSAQELDSRLASFLYHPNPMSLTEVRQAWRNAYSAYLQTLIYSKLPINDPPDWHKKGIDYQHTLSLLDSWPIEGGYIDHVPGYPFSGIVNDLTLELNEDSLLAQHGFSDPSYASLGYHAFEFMLWGADGQRSPRDFFPQENTAPVVIASEGGNSADTLHTEIAHPEEATAIADEEPADVGVQNHNRRRQYVQLLSEQLQKHLHRLQRRWEPSNGYYASLLQHSEPEQVLKATFSATQKLLSDELLGKRLNGTSSEFSQTTWADTRAIVAGIRNLYFPLSETEAGTGLPALLGQHHDDLSLEWQRQLQLIDDSIDDWQQQTVADAEARQQCRQRIIELMSLLQRTASMLNVPLASAN